MPSKEEKCVLSASNSTTTQDFLARDMEELVSEIKENLRLSAGLKSRPSFSVHHKSRASPYRVPSRSWGDSSCDGCLRSPSNSCGGHSCITVNKKLSSKSSDSTTASDDPYEMLQELLRDGSLIKEAFRRLQRGLSPKQRYFYDSDEETRSPLRMCHVELWVTRQMLPSLQKSASLPDSTDIMYGIRRVCSEDRHCVKLLRVLILVKVFSGFGWRWFLLRTKFLCYGGKPMLVQEKFYAPKKT